MSANRVHREVIGNTLLKHCILAGLLLVPPAAGAFAATDDTAGGPDRIRVLSLYGGTINNTYRESAYSLDLDDSGAMFGLYAQWIETGVFQANLFAWYAPDVNYSKTWGLHANADAFFLGGDWGSLVAGLDVETIDLKLDAGANEPPYTALTQDMNVLFVMLRAGARFKFDLGNAAWLTVFPFAGYTREKVSGTLTYAMPGPPPGTVDLGSSDDFPSWGLNLRARLFHFLELGVKYLGRAKPDDYLSSVTLQVDWSLTRAWALSYMYKHMQISGASTDGYHLFGLGCVF